MAYALWSRARLRPRCRAPVNWWSRGELRAKFLCFSFLRREALWPGSAALLLLQRRIPLLLQRQPRCKLALCCLLSAGTTQGRRTPEPASSARRVPNELSQQSTAEETNPLTRGYAACLDLKSSCFLGAATAVVEQSECSRRAHLSTCTATPTAARDLLRGVVTGRA